MRFRLTGLLAGLIGLTLIISVTLAQGGMRAVVVNEFLNIRITPALGAPVIATVDAGYAFDIITARSADNEWLRVDYNGQEAWINVAPLVILSGDMAALPVADPRTIPYGGFEAPRSGSSDQVGPVAASATNGLRIRSGPSTGYPTIGNIFARQGFTITGRTGSNLWFQVNFEGLLGWVSSQYVQILSGDVFQLPIDGIVAQSPPLATNSDEDYIAMLRLLLDRINLAQPSLDSIRGSWTDSALTGRASCQPYPARPSNISIAVPLLAANFQILDPLQRDFNDAMTNLRLAIDLFIEVCNQPGTGNPVGQATVQGALNVVNLVDRQFQSLRERLLPLVPSGEPGPNECLLTYRGRSEILPLIQLGPIYLEELGPRKTAVGYCFDGLEGQTLSFQTLGLPGNNLELFLAASPLDAPTSFVTVARSSANAEIVNGPVTLTRTTRYVLIIADQGSVGRTTPITGQFALRLVDITAGTSIPLLAYDPETDSVIITTQSALLGFDALDPTQFNEDPLAAPPSSGIVCPSTQFTCNQLVSCEEALVCLASGAFQLDPDADGTPCEENLCSAP